jgi:hypothetical protein
MQVAYVRFEGKQALLQLTPMKDLGAVTIPWEPNVFGGSRQDPRKTISFSVPEEIRQQMELVEGASRDKLRESLPKIDSARSSSTTPPGKHPSLMRAKIVGRARNLAPVSSRLGRQCRFLRNSLVYL